MDIYNTITATVLCELVSGRLSWRERWKTTGLPLRWNGVPYKGINTLVLWAATEINKYSSPFWLTYKTAVEVGGYVKKGEKGTWIVYYGTHVVKGKEGDEEDSSRRILRAYPVFNAEQCDSIVLDAASSKLGTPLSENARIDNAEYFFRNVGADVRHGGNNAYYNYSGDYIQLPPFEHFKTPELYYATSAHEHVHWTRHPSRLARDFGRQRWGDEGYAMEELVAELGAAFLSAKLGIPCDIRDDHAGYIQSWITVLKEHNRAIITAAAAAQKAVEFMEMKQLVEENDDEGSI